jgi:hypothetical protein
VLKAPSDQDFDKVRFDSFVSGSTTRHFNHLSIEQFDPLLLDIGQVKEFFDRQRRCGGAHD